MCELEYEAVLKSSQPGQEEITTTKYNVWSDFEYRSG